MRTFPTPATRPTSIWSSEIQADRTSHLIGFPVPRVARPRLGLVLPSSAVPASDDEGAERTGLKGPTALRPRLLRAHHPVLTTR